MNRSDTFRLIDLGNEIMVARREGIVREFGMNMYTLLYFKWIINKVLLYNTGNSAQCYVATWMGGDFRGEWTHVYAWLSPFTVHMKLSPHG